MLNGFILTNRRWIAKTDNSYLRVVPVTFCLSKTVIAQTGFACTVESRSDDIARRWRQDGIALQNMSHFRMDKIFDELMFQCI